MELVKIIWVIVFFLFALTLIFTWSKVAIISRKVRAIDANLAEIERIDQKPAPAPPASASDGGSKPRQ